MTRLIMIGAVALLFTACDRGSAPPAAGADGNAAGSASGATGTGDAGAGAGTTAARGPVLTEGWQQPGSGWIAVRREQPYDLTGDGEEERVVVTAEGSRYDSLDIALHIRNARGDTLWYEAWQSLRYFQYDPLQGKADSTVARIVQSHVDTLVHASRFSARGLPPQLRRGDPNATVNESVQYHLAEIDYRNRASLEPRDATPPGAWDRIDASAVGPDRIRVVRQELEAGPTFMYYAGGEATYALGWSVREQSFVRLYSCC